MAHSTSSSDTAPASLRLNWYSSSVMRARPRAARVCARMRAVRLLATTATTANTTSVTTFSGSVMVKV